MADVSQGPGWWLASDGRWYPPQDPPAAEDEYQDEELADYPIGPASWRYRRLFPISAGIDVVTAVFQFAAILVLLATVLLAIEEAASHSLSNKGWAIGSTIGGGILGAASLAFFAYVLALLSAIEVNTRRRPEADDEDAFDDD